MSNIPCWNTRTLLNFDPNVPVLQILHISIFLQAILHFLFHSKNIINWTHFLSRNNTQFNRSFSCCYLTVKMSKSVFLISETVKCVCWRVIKSVLNIKCSLAMLSNELAAVSAIAFFCDSTVHAYISLISAISASYLNSAASYVEMIYCSSAFCCTLIAFLSA